MSLLAATAAEQPGENLVQLHGGRYRLTILEEYALGSGINNSALIAKGTAIDRSTSGLYSLGANLKLIDITFPVNGGRNYRRRIYETLTGEFVDEVAPRDETTENGLRRYTRVLIAAAGTAYSSYVVGTATHDGLTLAQRLVELTDAFTRITLVYGAAGVLSRTTDTRNNGALTTIVIESANAVPDTPSGYVLTGTQVVGEAGFETTRYTFTKGLGQISQQDDESANGKLLTRTIRHLAAPASSNPISTPSGYAKTGESYQEADGHRVWTASFAKGSGEISRDPQSSNNGKLLTLAIRRLSAPDATQVEADFSAGSGFVLVAGPTYQEADGHRVWTASFAKGEGEISRDPQSSNNGRLLTLDIRRLSAPTTTLVEADFSAGSGFVLTAGPAYQEADGHRIWSASFAKGDGEVSRRIVAEGQGARLVSVTTLYAPSASLTAPADAVAWDVQQRDGHQVENKTVLQGLDGASIVGESGAAKLAYSYDDLVDFELPGTLDIVSYTTTSPGAGLPAGQGIRLTQRPPITIKVAAKVHVFYQTSSALAAGDYTYDSATALWNPTSWPVIDANYIPSGGAQVIQSEAYRSYRMANLADSPKTLTAQTVQVALAWTLPVVFGTICAGGNGFAPVHSVTLSGGPANPAGVRYTLDVNFGNAPAFELVNGTRIWRKTIVVATITAV